MNDPFRRPAARFAPSPVFLGILAIAALAGWDAWREGPGGRFAVFVFVIASWVVSLCLHEFGHAFLAWRSGDRSAAERGYLTLNPARYANTLLSFVLPVLFVVLGGIGLPGGAVYVDRSVIRGRFRHSLISLAGPFSNAVFAAGLAYLIARVHGHPVFVSATAFLCFLQVTATLLNLLPVPGLDGYGIVEPYLPRHWVAQGARISGWGLLIVMGLLWFPPVNRVFFDAVQHLTAALGVDSFAVYDGQVLFEFWRR